MVDTFAPISGLEMAPGGQYGLAKYGDDRNLLVMFFNKAVEIPSESVKRGRRYTQDQIFIRIQHPGETLNIIERPVQENDKYRFRDQWSKFVSNRTQVPDGTPIDLLFPNHPAIGENLRAYGCYTIEQCASLSANAIETIGRGAQEFVNRAQKYLDSSDKGAMYHKLQAENDDLKNKIQSLEKLISQMKVQLDHLSMVNNDPIHGVQQPGFVPNYDVQTERINSTHVTKDLEKNAKRGRPRKTVEENITDPFATQPTEETPSD
jgi:hypothetical protein